MLGSFKVSGSNMHSMQRVLKKERDPIEVIFCTLFATALFIYVYYIMGTKFRQDQKLVAMLVGPGLVLLIALALTGLAVKKKMEPERRLIPQQRQYRDRPVFDVEVNRKRNLIINLAVCTWLALIAGFFLGDRSYWTYKTEIYSYSDLVSYVDIDPAKDSGTSYMDSGHVYFKENSYVLKNRYAKFHNGETYCAAPIVNGPFKATSSTNNANVVNGYIVPASGSFDWWAVGTNCCSGKGASNFTCGDIANPLSRSGMRLLSDNERPFYVLAVQEWSATYGLPSKHPLFFHWVKDPLATEGQDQKDAGDEFWSCLGFFVLGTFIISFLIQMALHTAGIS